MIKWLFVFMVSLIPQLSAHPRHQEKTTQTLLHEKFTSALKQIMFSDRPNINDFINEFPFAKYKVSSLPIFGSFYIDDIDDVIKNRLRSGLPWETNIHDLILKYAKRGTIAIDIGAHIGTHTLAMSNAVSSDGRVIAFEPQPKIFRELFLNMFLNERFNIYFYNCGVSDRNDFIELTPLVFRNEGGTGLWPLSKGTKNGVSLIPLDSLRLNNVSLIKIDVEGMEDLVLAGALQTILTNKPVILIEIVGGIPFENANDSIKNQIRATLEKLESLGYTTQRIGPCDYLALPT